MYHGWKVVACAFLIAVFGWGFGFYGIGVFLAELVERRGWATSVVASAVTVLYLVGAVLIAFIGNAFARFGPRRVVLVGMSAMGAAAIGLTWVTQPWQLYIVFPLMAGGWAAMSGAALNVIVAPWFERRRAWRSASRSTGRPSAGSYWSRRSYSSWGGSDSSSRCFPW
jgi:MFS family permease